MEDQSILNQLQRELPLVQTEIFSFADLREKWTEYFNGLIQHDFPKLVGLLYRMDISENKIKYLLKENPGEHSGKIITSLVIERLMQKIRSREEHRSKPGALTSDPDTELW
jgi:hypothetical protein